MINRAKALGLDGVCITEHDAIWPWQEIEALSRQERFPLFRGLEVSTNHGHILAFGLHEYDAGLWRAERLREVADETGALTVLCHPWRARPPALSAEEYAKRPVVGLIDEIEALNGNCEDWENERAAEMCRCLSLRGVGGSDAHGVMELGRCVTVFERPVDSEAQLVEELRAKRFRSARRVGASYR
jgi:predicted metal-dependent phosphoesterase TrpH